MPAYTALFVCLGLQSLISYTAINAAPTFGAIAFPNMLAVNASASASASASSESNSTLAVGDHANATAGTTVGKSGALTMPGLTTPTKTCTCQESSGTPPPPPPPPPANPSAVDAKEPNPSIGSGDSKNPPEPSQLQATSPDTPGNDTYAPPSDASSQNATSATPPAGNTTATPEVTSGSNSLFISSYAQVAPLAITISSALGLLYL